MAKIQKQLEEFADLIRLGTFDENATLREKRDRVLDKLKAGLKRQREDGKEIPSFTHFNQGSYAMHTGVKPSNGDYDIDVGIEFDLKTSQLDPVEVKKWVFDALDGHTKKVEIRQPCVTVFYQQAGEDAYHVDLAIYGAGSGNGLELARGKLNSAVEAKQWEESDPKGLIASVRDRFHGDERQQFRRIVRLLKMWKSEKFNGSGNSAPPGIGLTVAAHDLFVPKLQWDQVANVHVVDDLSAAQSLVDAMLARFRPRIRATLPVAPRSDVFEKMTDAQIDSFKERLETLKDALDDAAADPDPHTACKTLRKQFGDDFPVPEKSSTAQSRGPAIVSSGSSA